jgi:hypothetical protein
MEIRNLRPILFLSMPWLTTIGSQTPVVNRHRNLYNVQKRKQNMLVTQWHVAKF